MAGSVQNYELAQYTAKKWREYGLEDVELVEHPVYLPWPVRYEATLVESKQKLSLKEDPVPQDKDSYSGDVGIPYCAYSADIDVAAPVVYVNSGNPEDYDLLARQGLMCEERSRSHVIQCLTATGVTKRSLHKNAARRPSSFIPIPLTTDSKKVKFIRGDHGALRATCNEAASFTTSTCPAIRARPVGLQFRVGVFFPLKLLSRCRRSQRRRCRTKTRGSYWKT